MMKKKYIWLIATIVLVIAASVTTFRVYQTLNAPQPQLAIVDTTSHPLNVKRLYGLPMDSFKIETGKIGRNENLGQILQQFNLPDRGLTQLILYGSKAFDLRKIHTGNPYTVFLSADSLARLQYLVYEQTPIDYVVFDFTDSLRISQEQKEVTTVRKHAQGVIRTSLWDAITEEHIDPMVALKLADIYAWTVDFFGLQPGDHFDVIYDELYVDSTSVGLGEIYGADFNFAGQDIMAIPFTQDSVLSYFDQDGKSLRRAFLKAPLRFNHISSRFSSSRLHPILKIRRPHYGVDYAAPIGTPVHTIGDGRVMEIGYQPDGGGRFVKVRHNSEYTTTYMHLHGFAKGLHIGDYVKQGDLIGYVGQSGLATGPHLDFRVYKYGTPIDPLKMESPPVSPIKPENLQAFNTIKTETMQELSAQPNELGDLKGKQAEDQTNPDEN
jgi:murein DD-endopeptidase MepM/ murein hydrolase activator NlpD